MSDQQLQPLILYLRNDDIVLKSLSSHKFLHCLRSMNPQVENQLLETSLSSLIM